MFSDHHSISFDEFHKVAKTLETDESTMDTLVTSFNALGFNNTTEIGTKVKNIPNALQRIVKEMNDEFEFETPEKTKAQKQTFFFWS
ncbi:unnamed protein product [Ambrosiozyma monospora]|uniref:Unnamed protein product n=1 Tax=Ambrosiozyma monospora TaxID=43982 RepID=A0ACB5TAI5_AMBMO|nr:unnamed protein product [Ambrosiozyma monospora]